MNRKLQTATAALFAILLTGSFAAALLYASGKAEIDAAAPEHRVVISAKRLTPAEKEAMAMAEHREALALACADSVEHRQ